MHLKKPTNLLIVFSPSAGVTTPSFKMCPQKQLIWDGNVCRGTRGEQELPKVYLLLEKVFLCQRRPRLPPPPSRSLLSLSQSLCPTSVLEGHSKYSAALGSCFCTFSEDCLSAIFSCSSMMKDLRHKTLYILKGKL